jgi:hypothetical protein
MGATLPRPADTVLPELAGVAVVVIVSIVVDGTDATK